MHSHQLHQSGSAPGFYCINVKPTSGMMILYLYFQENTPNELGFFLFANRYLTLKSGNVDVYSIITDLITAQHDIQSTVSRISFN